MIKLVRVISSRLNEYPNNLEIILNDVIEENHKIIMNVLYKQQNKDCYKRAVAINDCIYTLGIEQLYSLTISKKQIEKLYDVQEILQHKENVQSVQAVLLLHESAIKEFIAFDEKLKQKENDKIVRHEKLTKGTFDYDLKHMSFSVLINADSTYSYKNIRLKDKSKTIDKELIL